MTIAEKLDQLDNLQCLVDTLKIAYQQKRDDAIPDEVEAILADIDAEYLPQLDAVEQKIILLEAEIRTETLTAGETVKGKHLMAIWNKGRVSWDSRKLEGMMALIPQLKEARKEGQPTISMKRI